MDLSKHTPIGTFICGDKLRVTDPCYDFGVWCTVVLDVEPGTYLATARRERFHDWGERTWELVVTRDNVDRDALTWEQVDGEAGVDSGQCGFYDDAEWGFNKGDYGDENSFYRKVCDETIDDGAALRSRGVFTSSGLGDGGYPVLVAKNAEGVVVGAAIVFLSDEEDEGYDDEEDHED